MVQSNSTNLSRSVSSAGEHESSTYQVPPLPKRAETFSGFEAKDKEKGTCSLHTHAASMNAIDLTSVPNPEHDFQQFAGAKKARLESVVKDSVIASSTESIHSRESSSPTASPVISHRHKKDDADTDSLLSVDSALTQRVR